MKEWLQKLLFDWVFVLLYRMLEGFLYLVDFIESFFDVFAGTAKIFYKGDADFLLNVFFGHDAVTNAFWAMALIAIVLAFAFCIVQMARKATDIAGTVRQSVGQIMSNFFRCLLIVLLLNAGTVAAINISNVLLDRINFALENAVILNQSEDDKTFTEQEYATMTKILATVANYSVNPSADSRYNVNSCFNAIRPDLLGLYVNGFFDYDYPLDENGHYTWQGALALLAASADLTQDLNLSTYYTDVVSAFQTVSKEISTYSEFAPIKSAHFATPGTLDTDDLIFLIVGMEAAQNSMYNTGNFYDSIRKGYISGEKSYHDLAQVRKDFDIWEMDYLVGYISCITFILILAICIFTFIVRIFNILLLYITAPLFVSSMPLDDGSKWTSWVQAFVIQLFSGFGLVIAMRLYLIIIPIVVSSDLVFFAGTGTGTAILNHMAQLLMVLGGAWAVLQSGSVITGILAGNPGMAAIQQEGRMGAMVTGWAMRAPRAAMENTGKLVGGAVKAGKHLAGAGERHRQKADKKADLASRKAQQRQNMADAKFAQAGKKMSSGASARSVNSSMNSANRAQRSADRAIKKADGLNLAVGRKATGIGSGSGFAPGGRSGSAKNDIQQGGVGGHGLSGGGVGPMGGPGGGDNTAPPARSSNPYTPDMYDTSHLGGTNDASGGSSVSGVVGVGSSNNVPAGGPSAGQRARNLSSSGVQYTSNSGTQPSKGIYTSAGASRSASNNSRNSNGGSYVSSAGNSNNAPAGGPSAVQRSRTSGGVQHNAGGGIQPKGFSVPGGVSSHGGSSGTGGYVDATGGSGGSSGQSYSGSSYSSGSSSFSGGGVSGGSSGSAGDPRGRNFGPSGVQYTSGGGQSQSYTPSGGSNNVAPPPPQYHSGGVRYTSGGSKIKNSAPPGGSNNSNGGSVPPRGSRK